MLNQLHVDVPLLRLPVKLLEYDQQLKMTDTALVHGMSVYSQANVVVRCCYLPIFDNMRAMASAFAPA